MQCAILDLPTDLLSQINRLLDLTTRGNLEVASSSMCSALATVPLSISAAWARLNPHRVLRCLQLRKLSKRIIGAVELSSPTVEQLAAIAELPSLRQLSLSKHGIVTGLATSQLEGLTLTHGEWQDNPMWLSTLTGLTSFKCSHGCVKRTLL